MKKILYLIFIIAGMYSCEIDNFTSPSETLSGQITDMNGVPLQMEQGSGSGRMKIEELRFENPIPVYLNFKQDGTYNNSKIFAGEYRVYPVEGPYYPLDSAEMKIVDIQGKATANFEVVPYLNLEWIGEPSVTADNKIVATFRFTRNPAPAGQTEPALSDYQLFISTTQYVGNNNYDNTIVGSTVNLTDGDENQEITITSTQPMKYSTTFFIRIGARVKDNYKKYNYTTIKPVTVP
ncbi:DUF3823 domain-containing protein [Sunxiuqinia sp. A32]|uniref:DUF3823 domain-containing protein n=1 Tax=Sunxiuqinia sp. A32 TaxID=3461496 RepID=UPI0040465EA8